MSSVHLLNTVLCTVFRLQAANVGFSVTVAAATVMWRNLKFHEEVSAGGTQAQAGRGADRTRPGQAAMGAACNTTAMWAGRGSRRLSCKDHRYRRVEVATGFRACKLCLPSRPPLPAWQTCRVYT